jgi:hypothetical protein
MMSPAPKNPQNLRSLAAQLRKSAGETGFHMYQRKFESLAQELEEAARDAESRTLANRTVKPDG